MKQTAASTAKLSDSQSTCCTQDHCQGQEIISASSTGQRGQVSTENKQFNLPRTNTTVAMVKRAAKTPMMKTSC